MTKITNISPGPRGVNTEDGVVILAPGDTRDLKVSTDELKTLSEDWFRQGAVSKAEVASATDADAAAQAEIDKRVKAEAEAKAAADKKL